MTQPHWLTTGNWQPIEDSSIRRAEMAVRMHTAKLVELRKLDDSCGWKQQSIELSETRIAQYTAAAEARKEGK